MHDGADHLAEILVACLSERPIPPAARAWFLDGCLRSMRRGENIELGLGLAAAGRRSLQLRLMERLRDSYLCEALDTVSLDADLILWQRCVRLAPLIGAFLRVDWPRSKRLEAPPDGWPAFKRSLWHAAMTGRTLPRSPHALQASVARMVGYSRNAPSLQIAELIRP